MNNSKPIKLVVRGMENVPSFKNQKVMITRPTPRLITKPERQRWMDRAAASIASQLGCLSLTAATGTPMGQSPRSWILSSLPLDDSLVWIGVPCGSWQRVKKGEEGFEMTIEAVEMAQEGGKQPG